LVCKAAFYKKIAKRCSGMATGNKWGNTPLYASLGGATTHFAVNKKSIFVQKVNRPKYA